MRLAFTIPGPPVPKARARVVSHVGKDGKRKTRGITPKRTEDYEKRAGLIALAARLDNWSAWPWKCKEARFGILARVFFSGHEGDGDNYVKAIADACNEVLWQDDRQVYDGRWIKEKVERGQERIEVEAWVIEGGNGGG